MRRSFEVVLFYIFATASANLLSAAIPGLSIAHGTGAAREGLSESVNNFNPSGGLADTLFGSLLAVLDVFEGMVTAATALPTLLGNLGVPGPIVAFLMAPLGFIIVYDGMHIMSGRLN